MVKKNLWRSAQYKGKGDDGKKTNAEKVKPEKVKMAEKLSDSGSDSSWFVQDVSETIEEAKVKWVTGDGLSEEDTGSTYPMKSVNSEAVLITEECELGESVSAPGLVPSVLQELEFPPFEVLHLISTINKLRAAHFTLTSQPLP